VANAIVTIPIKPGFGSLNLAQAVLVLVYEWSRGAELAMPPDRTLEPVAPHGDLDGLIAQLDAELLAKGYFHPPERSEATRNTLRTIFTKANWSAREVKAVRGIIRALSFAPRVRGGGDA
jgi:tRNA/rRNA methyltransferase